MARGLTLGGCDRPLGAWDAMTVVIWLAIWGGVPGHHVSVSAHPHRQHLSPTIVGRCDRGGATPAQPW